MGHEQAGEHWALALHGGAGVINSDNAEWIATTRAGLEAALDVGAKILAGGGSALDAVAATVAALEDNPCFNAGRGSVLTLNGHHELEASIMTHERRCGAAALLTRVRNPVLLARKVMEATPHCFLAGPPAEAFAQQQGLALAPSNEWFTTPQRRAQWEAWREKGVLAKYDDIVQQGAPAAPGGSKQHQGAPPAAAAKEDGAQTVGAVAVDAQGRLAAATSTGGRCGKWEGRVGDTPIIGAGNWADASVALSGTGLGEEFLRRCACHDVAARVAYAGATLAEAMRAVLTADMAPGDGGFIGVTQAGDIQMQFNSQCMARACADSSGRREVAIGHE